MHLFDFPRHVPRDAYDAVSADAVDHLRRDPAVVAIYQFGGIGAPGISDLDLLVVVKGQCRVTVDPMTPLSPIGKYLFTHSPFAISRERLSQTLRLSPCDGLRLAWGEDLADAGRGMPAQIPPVIARQIAMEYLVGHYMVRTVEARYGVLSVRSVLLSSYALRHDLAILGNAPGPLTDHVAQVSEWRARWFRQTVAREEILHWFPGFLSALAGFLRDLLASGAVALPRKARAGFGRHIRLVPGDRLSIRHRGLVFPGRFASVSRRFVRLQHRLNRFEFTVPAAPAVPGSALDDRFEFFREMLAERRRFYPQFAPLATPWVANLS